MEPFSCIVTTPYWSIHDASKGTRCPVFQLPFGPEGRWREAIVHLLGSKGLDMTVVDLSSRRPASADDPATCACGSAWWVLKGPSDFDRLGNGAVTATTTGRITGYAGALVCLECGAPGPATPLAPDAY